MLRKEGGGGAAGKDRGRRPVLTTTFDRQMLVDIRDTLQHHLRKPNGDNNLLAKSELSQSTPNLLERVNGNSASSAPHAPKNMDRLGYNQMAMAEIRQSLRQFELNDTEVGGNAPCIIANGLNVEVMPVNKHMLQQLMSMGADEVSSIHNICIMWFDIYTHVYGLLNWLLRPLKVNCLF